MANLPKKNQYSVIMETIISGAVNRKVVTIRYHAQSNHVSERQIEPYEFKNMKLYAYCLTKGGIRAFNLANILTAVNMDESFEPRYPVRIS